MKKLFDVLKKDFYDYSSFYNNLIKIALPIVIQNLIISSLNMVDTLMIGKIGEVQIASVGIANQYFFLFNLIVMGVYSGCGIFISQFWGKEDVKNIKKILGIGLISGVIIAILFTLVALTIPDKIIAIFNTNPKVISEGSKYLKIVCISYIFTALTFNYSIASRCIQNSFLPMVISSLALLCNIFFNYILIFGHLGFKPMGVSGAAVATLISRVVETIILIGYIYIKKGILAAKIKEMMDFTKEFLTKVVNTIVTVVLNEACWGLGFVIYSVVYGRIGTQAMASIQICNTVQNLFMVIIFGMANAAIVMIGNKVGEDKEDEAISYSNRFIIVGGFIGILLSVFLILISPTILSLFNISKTVYHDSLIILYIISAIMVIRVFDIILIVGILRGGGDTKYALIAEASTMWLIGVPLAFLGAFLFKLPVYLVYALVTIEEIVKFIVGLMRFLSKRWVKNVIKDM